MWHFINEILQENTGVGVHVQLYKTMKQASRDVIEPNFKKNTLRAIPHVYSLFVKEIPVIYNL